MQGWARVVAHAQAKLLGEVAGLWDMRESDPTYTGSDLAAYCEFVSVEVGLALRLGPRAAETLVDDAVTLTRHLPSTVQALEAGRIDLPTARAIADETAFLSKEATARVEAAALAKAETSTARSVRMFARRQAITEDPSLMAERAKAAADEIGVTKTDIVDGVGDLVVTLSATDRCAVWTALTEQAQALKAVPGEARSLTRLRAVALVDMLTRPWLYVPAAEQLRHHLEAQDVAYEGAAGTSDATAYEGAAGTSDATAYEGAAGTSDATAYEGAAGTSDTTASDACSTPAADARASSEGRQSGLVPAGSALTGPVVVDPTRGRGGKELSTRSGRWKVDVIVNLTTLLGLDDVAAVLVGSGPITADVARQFAADGVWRRLVTDPVSGVVIERSTTRYRPTTALADHVEARDQHCQTPGCRRVAYECEKDHRKPYDQGGPTCLCNVWALCKHHHRCKHSPGWRFRREPDGTTTVTSPTGHSYTGPAPTPWD